MGKVTGFLEIERRDRGYEKPEKRLENYREFVQPLPYAEVGQQAAISGHMATLSFRNQKKIVWDEPTSKYHFA